MSAGKRKLWHEENDFANLKNCKKLKSTACFNTLKTLTNYFPNSSSFFSPKSSKAALPTKFSHLSSYEILNKDGQIDSGEDDLINSIVDVDDEPDQNKDIDSIIDDDDDDETCNNAKKDANQNNINETSINTPSTSFSNGSMLDNCQYQSISKSFQLNESTPIKFHPKEDDFVDSGKKKKQKFTESGLASRLKILINQKHRDKIFRSHRMKMLSATGEACKNHEIINCELSSRGITAGQLVLFDCIIKNGSVTDDAGDELHRRKILINKHLVSEIGLGYLSLVDVKRPWYVLSLGEDTKVIFTPSCSKSK